MLNPESCDVFVLAAAFGLQRSNGMGCPVNGAEHDHPLTPLGEAKRETATVSVLSNGMGCPANGAEHDHPLTPLGKEWNGNSFANCTGCYYTN